MSVNAGKRVVIEGHAAGFTERDGGASLAVPTAYRPAVGSEIEVDGRRWSVVGVGSSLYVRGMRIVELRPVEGS